jgi:hypothetical protein
MDTLSPVLSLEPFLGNVFLGWVASVFFPFLSGIFLGGQIAKQVQNGKKCLMGFWGFFLPFNFLIKKSSLSILSSSR